MFSLAYRRPLFASTVKARSDFPSHQSMSSSAPGTKTVSLATLVCHEINRHISNNLSLRFIVITTLIGQIYEHESRTVNDAAVTEGNILVPHRLKAARLSCVGSSAGPEARMSISHLDLGSSLRIPGARGRQSLAISDRLPERRFAKHHENQSEIETFRLARGSTDIIPKVVQGVAHHAFGLREGYRCLCEGAR